MGRSGTQTSSTTNSEAKERVYIERIKTLKAENKRLIQLLRDSEKIFYQKLKESKKESENLSTLFKQLWPLIKHKVKDPHGLLKTVNGL
jgi:LPS O-antigen subunit length determinant protein (WzzB/FepE family)